MHGWVVVLMRLLSGHHCVVHMNDGEVVLSWCARNGLVVMNAVFEKKSIHQYTLQHPGSKQWHCINYMC